MQKSVFISYEQYSFGLLFSRNVKKTHTDQGILQLFLLSHALRVQVRSFFWSIFSCIWTKYRKIRTRKYSIFGHFSRSDERNESQILKVAAAKYLFSKIYYGYNLL